VSTAQSDFVKFIDDSASTCIDDDVSFMSDETCLGDCIEWVSPRLDWAEEMLESEAPNSPENLPSIWAITSESFVIPPGQWASTCEKPHGPPGKLVDFPGTEAPRNAGSIKRKRKRGLVRASGESSVSGASASIQSPEVHVVDSVKNVQRSDPEAWFQYSAEYGKNIRDPRRHSVQFLEEFLRQYNDGTHVASTVACSKSDAPPGPPGKLV